MATIDMALVKKRESEMRLSIRQSSPVLIWSGAAGIWIIAASRLDAVRKKSRVYQVLDRIAYIGRGNSIDNRGIAGIAVVHGERLAGGMSRGDVQAAQIVQEVGSQLSRSYYNYIGAPTAVESVVMQLQQSPEEDDLTYISFKGKALPFEKAIFLGACDLVGENESQEEKDLSALNEQLRDSWEPDARVERINEIFLGLPMVQSHQDLNRAFAAKRIETVLLDRQQLHERRYEKIFQRLT